MAETIQKPGALPGPKSQELANLKKQYVPKGISTGMPFYAEKAKGALIEDVDGNTFIDFAGGIGVLNTGHCPDEVVAAIKEQTDKFLHTCFMVVGYQSYVDLAKRLSEIAPGDSPKKAFFVNSGAEAVENAVKIARLYTKRTGIVSFDLAFHGRTLLTMTLTSKVKPYKFGFGPFAPDIYKIPYAYCYRCMFGLSYPDCGMHCLENFERFFMSEVPAENIAAIIAEPVQGEGGFIVPPKEFFSGLREICDQNGILFICDEIQTGFARTGKMFAIEHWNVEPDIMTMAKSLAAGVPLSAVAGKAEIMDTPDPGQIGGTYGGNPLGCVAGLEVIKIIERDNLKARAELIGKKVMDRFAEMKEKYSLIGDIRGLGAMVALELVKDRKTKEPAKDETKQIIEKCYRNGLITLSAGILGNVIRVLMPLTIMDEQLEHGLSILENAIADVQG